MSHLGERITELVDGQLPPEAAEKANVHLAGCRACRDAAEVERLTKHRLRALPEVAPSSDLLTRLMTLGGPAGPLPPRDGHVPGTPRPLPVPLESAAPGSRRPPLAPSMPRSSGRGPARAQRLRGMRRPRRLAAAVVGALSAVGVGVAGLLVATSPTATPVVPPVDAFVVEHQKSTSSLPFSGQQVSWLMGGREK